MENPLALSEKLRHSIFRKLSPIIGEEETEAVLSNFPARDVEEPATKELVQLEVALLRTEIAEVRTAVANFRAEVHQLANRIMVTMITAAIALAGLAVTIALNQN